MRLIVIVFLLFSSLYSYSQLYIPSGTVFTLNGSETQLCSNESTNIINSHLQGTGVFRLLGESVQYLESSKKSLELPNLVIKNAFLLNLNTALSISNELLIENGILVLSHDLTLSNPDALILKGSSEVIETSNGKLLFLEYFNERPFANATVPVFYVYPMSSQNELSFIIKKVLLATHRLQYIDDYKVIIKINTPPPKLV
tara:strand:+ start:2071 stop:2670 length:600 start_codon:yes stop_codon:yes gene_type:complete